MDRLFGRKWGEFRMLRRALRSITVGRRTPPPGLALGEPDDRHQRSIKHDLITGALEYWVPAFRGDDQ
jgi:hypothetical protein